MDGDATTEGCCGEGAGVATSTGPLAVADPEAVPRGERGAAEVTEAEAGGVVGGAGVAVGATGGAGVGSAVPVPVGDGAGEADVDGAGEAGMDVAEGEAGMDVAEGEADVDVAEGEAGVAEADADGSVGRTGARGTRTTAWEAFVSGFVSPKALAVVRTVCRTVGVAERLSDAGWAPSCRVMPRTPSTPILTDSPLAIEGTVPLSFRRAGSQARSAGHRVPPFAAPVTAHVGLTWSLIATPEGICVSTATFSATPAELETSLQAMYPLTASLVREVSGSPAFDSTLALLWASILDPPAHSTRELTTTLNLMLDLAGRRTSLASITLPFTTSKALPSAHLGHRAWPLELRQETVAVLRSPVALTTLYASRRVRRRDLAPGLSRLSS